MRATSAALAVCAFFAALVWWIFPAEAHEWYDRDCCSGRDCAAVALDAASLARIVDIGPAGVHVRIQKGDHAVFPDGYGDRLFEWGHERLRPSQDDNWHVCMSSYPAADGRRGILCVYYPPMMF